MRPDGNEVNVEALAPSTKFAQATALQILEVYPPALLLQIVGCEIMLGLRRPLANSCNVLPDLGRKRVYVLRVPRIVPALGT